MADGHSDNAVTLLMQEEHDHADGPDDCGDSAYQLSPYLYASER